MKLRFVIFTLSLLFSCGPRFHQPLTDDLVTTVGFPVEKEWPKSLDKTAFERLKKRAEEERTTALVLIHEGKLIHASNPLGKGHWNEPAFAMSVTKSIVALALGGMSDMGMLKLDEPLSRRVIPEWKDDQRSKITLRHMLNHTSGLDKKRASEAARDGGQENAVINLEEHGLRARLRTEVGSTFEYNNQVADFLSVVAKRAMPKGQAVRFDDYLQLTLFRSLGVIGAAWIKKDVSGDPFAAGELMMRPIDLAKIGQLVLDEGMWQGKRLLSKEWITEMVAQGSPHKESYGLLWWRRGKRNPDKSLQAVWGYEANGYLGQYILVVPEKRLVAVRMRDPRRAGFSEKKFNYETFKQDVFTMVGLSKSDE